MKKWLAVNKTAVLIGTLAVIIVVSLILVFKANYLYDIKPDPQPIAAPQVSLGSSSASNAQQSESEADTLAHSFVLINPVNAIFTIASSSLAGVSFQITRVAKAVGPVVTQTGCTGLPSKLFLEYLYFGNSGLCLNSNSLEGQPLALVAVDIQVMNAGPARIDRITSKLIQLFYTVKVGGQDVTRVARSYLSPESYSVDPFSNTLVRVGFIVPQDQDKFELPYGYVSSIGYSGSVAEGEYFFSQAIGSFSIDFGSKTFIVTPG